MAKKSFVKAPLKAPSEKRNDKLAVSGQLTRLPVYLPKGLHKRFKLACMMNDVSMAREVRDFIERRTAELEAKKSVG